MNYVESTVDGALASGTCCQSSDCTAVTYGIMLDLGSNGHFKNDITSENPLVVTVTDAAYGFLCTKQTNYYCLQVMPHESSRW